MLLHKHLQYFLQAMGLYVKYSMLQVDGASLSDEEVSTQVGAFFQEAYDSMSVSSIDSRNLSGEKKWGSILCIAHVVENAA